MYRRKNIVIIVMIIAIMIMATGYAYFSTNLKIDVSGSISSTWKVYFSKITEGTPTGSASNYSNPVITDTTATISADLKLPGDSMTYEVTLTNGGDIDAVISDINTNISGTSAIIHTIEGIEIGDKLAKGESKVITIKIEYDINITSQPSNTTSTLTVSITTVQDIEGSSSGSGGGSSTQVVFNKEASSDLTFTSEEDISTFQEVRVDGTAVDSSNYTLTSGSTIVTLKEEYLQTLSAGTHTMDIVSTTKTVSTTFEVSTIKSNTSIVEKILSDNEVYADNVSSKYVTSSTGINFGAVSSDTNGKGLYYTSTNTEDDKTTYYFRGDVDNNYVKFGKDSSGNDIIWRIVRINEDGSIRIITEESVGRDVFHYDEEIALDPFAEPDNAYVGYMYGVKSSATYAETHANINDSTLKENIDTWYENNLLTNFSEYLVDAGFCGDRSVAQTPKTWYYNDTALGYGTKETYYGAYNRLINLKQPQYKCPNEENDLFTMKNSYKGNKALDYPIATITADEAVYAGMLYNTDAYNIYLSNGLDFFVISAYTFFGLQPRNLYVGSNNGLFFADSCNYNSYIRPVINLKGSVEVELTGTGNPGTSTNPYIIKTN